MPTCLCGETTVDASGFAFTEHRLHGEKACAKQHTLGEVIRAVADGARDAGAVAHTLAESSEYLVGEALSRLRDAGVVHFAHGAGIRLADGVTTQDDAERKLVAGGAYRPGDLVA